MKMQSTEEIIVDKVGSAASRLTLARAVRVLSDPIAPRSGDVVVVRALGESATYGNIELCNGRLARITTGDILVGVLGSSAMFRRRSLKATHLISSIWAV